MKLINGINFNKKTVLVAPLDWGLGHATRCIPIIKDLLINDCDVIIATQGAQEVLLKQEFPGLVFLDLKGYKIHYSRSKWSLSFAMLLQVPKILKAIRSENQWLKKTISSHAIDVVISDNRFGLYHAAVKSIYITHQLTIKTGSLFTDWLVQRLHFWVINKFDQCWVPDAAGENNFGGNLSHPQKLPKIPVLYLGPISRFERTTENTLPAPKKYDLLILLSGPEPQRTIFETILLKQLEIYNGKVLFLRGLPGVTDTPKINNTAIEMYNHLDSGLLNSAFLASALIVSRSGYTTVMDLAKLEKRAILVPTPGQTEQEYLAEYLKKKGKFYSIEQRNFNLIEAVKNAAAFYPDLFGQKKIKK